MSKTILAELNGFTPVIDCLVKEYGLVTAAAFGRIWRFCQMENGVCQASLETLASEIGLDKATIMRHAKKLVEGGYLKDLSPDLRNHPHTYADTGKVTIASKISVAHRNASVAVCNASVAENQLKIDSKIDSKKLITNPSKVKRPTPEGLPEPTGDGLGDWLEMGRRVETKNAPMVAVIEALAKWPYNFPHFGENKAFDRIARLIAADGRSVEQFMVWAKANKRDPHWYLVKPDSLWGDWPQAFPPPTKASEYYHEEDDPSWVRKLEK